MNDLIKKLHEKGIKVETVDIGDPQLSKETLEWIKKYTERREKNKNRPLPNYRIKS